MLTLFTYRFANGNVKIHFDFIQMCKLKIDVQIMYIEET